MIGDYKAIYEAQTNIPELKSGRQSGDIVTSLCVFALENRIADSVLAVKMDDEKPYKARPFIARTRQEIIQCAGSKYTFVNYSKLPLQLGGNSILVGLPCQMSRKKTDYVKIGLFCGLNTTDEKLDYILRWNRISKEEIEYLDWRTPKNKLLEIRLRSGKVYYLEHWFLNFFFTRPQCLRCTDYSSHFADIAVGDRRPGNSAVIVRSDSGNEIFTKAVKKGYIRAKEISLQSFVEYRMSPMLQKELRGGFVNVPLVRRYGKWINLIPPIILKRVGSKIASHIKKLTQAERAILGKINASTK